MATQADASALRCTAFLEGRQIATGTLKEVALATRHASNRDRHAALLVFDDATGRQIDLDLRGSEADVIGRLADHPFIARTEPVGPKRQGPGRPKLGVVAREVTLLPRHWEWLNAQPGGASVALRKLVDEARQAKGARDRVRLAAEAAYRFMSAAAGNETGYEEALRALFAKDRARFTSLIAKWPHDIRTYAEKLAAAAFPS